MVILLVGKIVGARRYRLFARFIDNMSVTKLSNWLGCRAAEVRFSPVQAGIFPNLEPNFRFGSGKCPNLEPNFRFRFAKVRFRFKNGSNSVRTPFLFKMPDRIIRHYVSKKISKILVL